MVKYNLIKEDTLTAKQRTNLDSSQFGLPKERKFPLNDAKHVRAAMSRFGYCPPDKKHQLAIRIKKAAKEFGIEISDDSPIRKYLECQTIGMTRYILMRESDADNNQKTKYEVLDNVPPELKDSLEKFLRSRGLAPNHYYPEDKSNNQALQRYIGIDERNWSCRCCALDKNGEIIALLDAIPLRINEGQLYVYAAYTYGVPTNDSKTNQKMIETLMMSAINNPDQNVKWMVFNDLSKHDDKRWINELQKFGFIQPYRFNNPAFKDTVVMVHVIRNNGGSQYPITFQTDVRNANENLPQNQAVL